MLDNLEIRLQKFRFIIVCIWWYGHVTIAAYYYDTDQLLDGGLMECVGTNYFVWLDCSLIEFIRPAKLHLF